MRVWPLPLLSLLLLLSASVAQASSKERDRLLAGHPIRETRFSTQAQDGYIATGVWKIPGARNTVYLGGTSHIIKPDQVPFPSSFYAAYNDSKVLYIEFDTDISLLTKVGFARKALQWIKLHRDELILPKGKRISDFIEPETDQKLRERYGRNYRKIERSTPVYVAFTAEMGLGAQEDEDSGVEDVFVALAKKDQKTVRTLDDKGVLDTVLLVMDEVFIKCRAAIAKKGADAVIRESLLDEPLGNLEQTVWRTGDPETLEKMQREMFDESPTIYQKALVERNQKWLPKIEAALKSDKNVFILVGAAHLPGKDGLIATLKSAGFKPERLHGLDHPPVDLPLRKEKK
jgi:uncharacterized protein YbaP (TraB family)